MKNRREVCVLFGGAAAVMSTGAGWAKSPARRVKVKDGLPRALPHEAGVDAQAVLNFLDAMAAAGLELNSFMAYRDGHVAAEGWWAPYEPNFVHMLHSASKGFTGTGVGIAIGEGLIALDDPVLKFFPGRVDRPSANLQAMTVESLLTQTPGHALGISGSAWRPIKTSWITEFLKVPVDYAPGSHFAYSSAASFMLSAIVGKASGQSLHDYMKPRLFAPMGMDTLRWDVGPEGINPGGNGVSTTTADFLKLGVVHLESGRWKGRQVIPADWTKAVAIGRHGNPYSYQWWIAPDDLGYYAAGKFGQFCFIFPGLDAVLTFTAGVADNAETREKVHATVFKHARLMFAGSKSASDEQALTRRIASLRVLPPLAPQASPLTQKVSGRVYRCEPNVDGVKEVSVEFGPGVCRFRMSDERGSHVVENGLSDWKLGETTITGGYLHHEYEPARMKVAAGARWGAPDRLDLTWQFVESGFRDTVALTFDGDTVRYDRGVNINSGPLKRPTIVGKAAG